MAGDIYFCYSFVILKHMLMETQIHRNKSHIHNKLADSRTGQTL